MLNWTNPTGGLFTSEEQTYFWQALWWLLSQAAPLLMILFAAYMVYRVFLIFRAINRTADEQTEPYYEDWEEDD